jgi:hypothetical protein
MKGFTKDGKFHPITDYKKVSRKKRLDYNDPELIQNAGVKITKDESGKNIRMKREPSKYRKKKFENAKIQSLIFNKKKFSMSEAKEWTIDHGYKAVKVEPTKNTWRIRQFSPNKIKRGTECKTIQFGGSGVQGVLCDTPDRFKREAKPFNVKDPLDETNTDRRKKAFQIKLSDDKSILSEPEINWMKKFLNNTFGMAKPTDEGFKAMITDKISEAGGFRISPELNQKGIDFLRKHKRKLSQRENLIIDNFDHFTFEEFSDPDNFGNSLQPVWRVHSTPTNGQSDDFEYQWIGGQFILR